MRIKTIFFLIEKNCGCKLLPHFLVAGNSRPPTLMCTQITQDLV